MSQNFLLRRMEVVNLYLNWINEEGFKLIDLNMIEPFYLEDKKYHPSHIVFERNYDLFGIRSDWTRSLLNYKHLYHLEEQKYGYYGPVLRDNQTIYQAGVEMFDVPITEITESIIGHIEFIQKKSEVEPSIMVVNDDKIIDLYLEKYKLKDSVRSFISEKDISSLGEALGESHPIYELMTVPVSQQYDFISDEFSGHEIIEKLDTLKKALASFNLKFILDLSFSSPQGYYDGFYFQIFLDKNEPVLSGGQYDDDAFGIALNLSEGGLI